jgi:succinate dehydrogenase/fumarate reductase-like Fe-S protein
MATGKKTGGRVKGTPNTKTAEKIEAIEASGLMPLDYMLSVMRDTSADEARRIDAAKAAAPYVHARLSNVDAKVEHSGGLFLSREED